MTQRMAQLLEDLHSFANGEGPISIQNIHGYEAEFSDAYTQIMDCPQLYLHAELEESLERIAILLSNGIQCLSLYESGETNVHLFKIELGKLARFSLEQLSNTEIL